MDPIDGLPAPLDAGDGNPAGRQRKSAFNPLEALREIREELVEVPFCPLCEVPDKYQDTDGANPILELRKKTADIIDSNRLGVVDFLNGVERWYKNNIQDRLRHCHTWRKRHNGVADRPGWSPLSILTHFTEHEPSKWLRDRIRLLQAQALLQQLADNASYDDGPPDVNLIKSWILVQQTEAQLYLDLSPGQGSTKATPRQRPRPY
jgi:hypothetical protein